MENGHSMMAYVTVTVLSYMTAAYAAAAGKEGLSCRRRWNDCGDGYAGEALAYEATAALGAGIGTFQQKLFDAIFAMDASTLLEEESLWGYRITTPYIWSRTVSCAPGKPACSGGGALKAA